MHDGLGGTLLLSLGGLLLAAAAETLTLHFLGTTPGKALLGLKIVREDGSRLSLGEAAWRTAGVTAFYGAGIFLADLGVLLTALAALAMLIWACWRVDKGELLPWEGRGQLYLEGGWLSGGVGAVHRFDGGGGTSWPPARPTGGRNSPWSSSWTTTTNIWPSPMGRGTWPGG